MLNPCARVSVFCGGGQGTAVPGDARPRRAGTLLSLFLLLSIRGAALVPLVVLTEAFLRWLAVIKVAPVIHLDYTPCALFKHAKEKGKGSK